MVSAGWVGLELPHPPLNLVTVFFKEEGEVGIVLLIGDYHRHPRPVVVDCHLTTASVVEQLVADLLGR